MNSAQSRSDHVTELGPPGNVVLYTPINAASLKRH